MTNKLGKIRPINLIEKEIIQKSLSRLSPHVFSHLSKQFHIYICFNPIWKALTYPSILLISHVQNDFMNLSETIGDIYSAGLYMGFIKNGNLLISLELLDFLKQQGFEIKIKKVTVNESGERSVLYGNDLSYKMVLSLPPNFKTGDEVLIVNKQDEILGLGTLNLNKEDILLLNSKANVVKNIIDKGYYLRKKQ